MWGKESEEWEIEGKMGIARTLESAKQTKPNYVNHSSKLFSFRPTMFHSIKIHWSYTHDFQHS